MRRLFAFLGDDECNRDFCNKFGSVAVSRDSVTTTNSLLTSLQVLVREIELTEPLEATMPTLQSKYEMKQMVLTELAGLCKRLGESSAITEEERAKVRQFVNEFDSLMSMRDKAIPSERFDGEQLVVQIARFLADLANDYDAYLDRAS